MNQMLQLFDMDFNRAIIKNEKIISTLETIKKIYHQRNKRYKKEKIMGLKITVTKVYFHQSSLTQYQKFQPASKASKRKKKTDWKGRNEMFLFADDMT